MKLVLENPNKEIRHAALVQGYDIGEDANKSGEYADGDRIEEIERCFANEARTVPGHFTFRFAIALQEAVPRFLLVAVVSGQFGSGGEWLVRVEGLIGKVAFDAIEDGIAKGVDEGLAKLEYGIAFN